MQTQYAPTPHGTMAYTSRGSGPQPVMFVHGLPTTRELWDQVLAQMPPGLHMVAPDLHDYGASARLRGAITHVERAHALDALRAHLGWERFWLVAHDLGASVATDYVGAHGDRVERLVLMSPPVYPDFREPSIVKLVRTPSLGEALVRGMGPALMYGAIARGMTRPWRMSRAQWRAFSRTFEDTPGRAALLRNLRWGRPDDYFAPYPQIFRKIDIPTLILQGRRDPYIPSEHVERLARDIPGSHLTYIEDAAHFLPMDAPRQVAVALRDFLEVST